MAERPVIYAFVFARGGSKGLPRKNLRLLAGKPLIAYSIELARQLRGVERIIVSTDDAEVASVAQEWGAEVPFMRPSELAMDTSPEWAAWQHALTSVGCTANGGPCGAFLSLPATAPLRSVDDVERCLDEFTMHQCDAVITTSPAARHPMFNMVEEGRDGFVHLAMKPEHCISRRQDAPPLYDITTAAYVLKPKFVLTGKSLMQGAVRQVVLPRERALDIDDALDLAFAEFMLTKGSC